MVNYWKSKVLPKIKKVFENKDKIAAAEACKEFEEAKEQYSVEFEEKKSEYEPKVVEIYEASPPEIKTLVKTPKASALKKNSPAVQKFLDELAKIEFPGSKPVCEAATKFGPGYVSGPIFFLFEKVSTFIVTEEVKTEEAAPPPAEAEAAAPPPAEKFEEEAKEKEIVVEVPAVPEKIETAACEPTKVEEAPPAPVVEPPKP
ncbi:hypothetical protein RD792_009656 [Penstemon davidsonii]|uniref:Plasma membrane-associated cation-binding protein 1 n=1 Tax=Penstemon davidsonii TaxID=160366 RepID=A0ABR0D1I6_9LAMI|nr:hypothetical protein RD792_009656 [Penstemon davidsonii]